MPHAKTAMISLVALCLLAGSAQAQKLYRWVDKDGKVHISDQLPPEAVDQARKEFNTKGTAIGEVTRALTPEEQARRQAEQAEAAKAAAEAEMLKRIEEGMLVNYETEDQLRRAYTERTDLVTQNLEATEISIRSQKVTLASLLNDAAESELAKRSIDPERAKIIRQMHDEITSQQALQIRQMASRAALDAEFERVLARYRELKGTAATPAPAATAPAATPAQSK